MKTFLTLIISLCFVFGFVFCVADVMAASYLKIVVTEVHGGHTNVQLGEIYFFGKNGAEIPPNTIKIFAPECAGKGDSDGYNWDHTHAGDTFKFVNALDRVLDTFFVITNNATAQDGISEKDPVPIVFEFHATGIQRINKIEWFGRQGIAGEAAPNKFYFEISSDGKDWQRLGGEYEDDMPPSIDKRIFENLNISLIAAVEPISKLATTWSTIKAH